MASPPSFSFSSSDDDDDEAPAAVVPTPDGLNDRLLRFTQSRRKLASSSSPPAAAAADDGDSIRDILDDLTARLDSMYVHNPRPGRRDHAPLPCALLEDSDCYYDASATNSSSSAPAHPKPEQGHGAAAVAPTEAKVVDLSSSDDHEAATAAVRRQVKVEKPQVPAKGASQEEKENRDKEDVGWEWEKTAEDFEMEPTGCGAMAKPYKLPGSIFRMLYPHQREGLKWLWDLHCRGTGGILGDDMGLGKTMQVAAFLAGLFRSRLIRRVLVVAPPTILTHWSKELSAVGLKSKIRNYSGTTSVKVRNSELQCAFKDGGVLLTTYGMVRKHYKRIRGDFYSGNIEAKYDRLIRGDFYNDAYEDEDGKLWDYVILDEGHVIKNPRTETAKSLLEIPCVHRIVISGTPMQNNLKEMWALFYFCCPEVLGNEDEFKTDYESAMTLGADKSASDQEKHIGSDVAKEYQERIKPYFLHRMKSEVFADTGSAGDKKLSKKNELIVWLKLTAWQRKLYEAFLNSDIVHNSIQGSPLAAIAVLKKICDHPMILTKRAAEEILEGMDGMLDNKDIDMVKEMVMNLADTVYDDEALQAEEEVSCKLIFIKSLLRKLLEEGHHVLIFSQNCKMLNLIQEAILLEGYKFLRIDGTTKERERIVKDFQEGSKAQIFLLTTRVGGLGLTLTKAARVIVVDPAWNPSTDNQAVDRAYRIGQTKDVIVYRLMTCGTIEEKIYRLQVFKGALFRTATEQKELTRYFSKRDQEIFSLPVQGFDVSLTQKQLQEEHGQQLGMDDPLMRGHIEFLEQQGIAGVSNHSLLFTKTAVLPTLSEHDALDSKPPSMCVIARQYSEASSSDYVANGAAHAFKPKDFTPRAYSGANSTKSESPEEIKAKINQLSKTLANTTLVSKLPDRGEKLKKQIHQLDEKLTVIESSPESASSRDARDDVICLDDQKYYDL